MSRYLWIEEAATTKIRKFFILISIKERKANSNDQIFINHLHIYLIMTTVNKILINIRWLGIIGHIVRKSHTYNSLWIKILWRQVLKERNPKIKGPKVRYSFQRKWRKKVKRAKLNQTSMAFLKKILIKV
jgi:hypothetical protein